MERAKVSIAPAHRKLGVLLPGHGGGQHHADRNGSVHGTR